MAEVGADAPESRTAIEATVQAMRDPELNAQMREMLPMFRGLLTERLAAAQADGRAGPGIQPAGPAVALAAMCGGLALRRLVDPDTDIHGAAAAVPAVLEVSA